jgi:hypothetical protein
VGIRYARDGTSIADFAALRHRGTVYVARIRLRAAIGRRRCLSAETECGRPGGERDYTRPRGSASPSRE